MKKGQLIPLVFVVILVALVLIGYIFFNIFYGARYQVHVFHVEIIDKVRNLVEDFKNYLRLSLTYSSHQALREHACLGGTIGSERNHWICNGPNPVEVDTSKQCLEVYTKYYLNEYSSLFNTSLPVQLIKYNFTNTIYGVDAAGVFAQKYDEGDFWVNSSGAKIAVTSKDVNVFEEITTQDFITKNRYWYLFKNFYQWAMDDVYSKCICSIISCSCPSSSGEEPCSSCKGPVEDCAKRALADLQRRFDENVTCNKSEECCRQGIGPACGYPNACLGWASRCAALCIHDCSPPQEKARSCPVEKARPSPVGLTSSPLGETFGYHPTGMTNIFTQTLGMASDISCVCDGWYEGRVAAIHSFTCEDHKYYVPSDKGPVPLKFTVLALATWRNPMACYSTSPCLCPENAISCAECTCQGGCTECH